MLRNVALNQLTVIERSALLLIFGLCRWLATRLLPGRRGRRCSRWRSVRAGVEARTT